MDTFFSSPGIHFLFPMVDQNEPTYTSPGQPSLPFWLFTHCFPWVTIIFISSHFKAISFDTECMSMELTNSFGQTVDLLIICICFIPYKSIGQVWWGRKPLLKESSYYSYHKMNLHQIKWYDGLGHGDLENWLISCSSGAQVGKFQICPWNCGFFMQYLGLNTMEAPNCHHVQPQGKIYLKEPSRATNMTPKSRCSQICI